MPCNVILIFCLLFIVVLMCQITVQAHREIRLTSI
uniref:Uncharacterized protein n=1 Tax=Arundo donax TaxID=35708 RepID=A0A0A9FAY3_ARUDO